MTSFFGYMHKELIEAWRTGKTIVMLLVSALFGIMNPFIAKIMPWLMTMMADQLSEAGVTITKVKVDALTSWTQFYKNAPIELIIFGVIFSGLLTAEYQRGTLTILLTKGLKRWQVIIAKFIATSLIWTISFWLGYFITLGYNAYFWTNQIANHLFLAAFCLYLLGEWLLSLILLISVFLKTNTMVLTITAGIFVTSYVLGLIDKISAYLPNYLLSAQILLTADKNLNNYIVALVIYTGITIFNLMIAGLLFNRESI